MPSGALQLAGSFPGYPVDGYRKQDANAPIGVREYTGSPIILIKFAFRQYKRIGRNLKRPCIINDLWGSLAKSWGPIRAIWAYVRKRVKQGNLAPHSLPLGATSIESLKL